MQYSHGICQLSVVPLRALPQHSSEMISQLIFGDTFEIIEQEGTWLKIKNDVDDYEGWLDEKQAKLMEKDEIMSLKKESPFLTREVYAMLLKGNLREPIYLPVGSNLPFFEDAKCRIGEDT
nr:SH3 domain-containing protein [Pseudopedobacter sp.]